MCKKNAQLKEQCYLVKLKGYTGRGLIQGLDYLGEFIQVYWISARTRENQERFFRIEDGDVLTVALHELKATSDLDGPPSLLYTAMSQSKNSFIASNGPQTLLIKNAIRCMDRPFDFASVTRYAPPVNVDTPRITGIINPNTSETGELKCTFSFILVRPHETGGAVTITWTYDTIQRGRGLCLSTYEGKTKELKPFSGAPYVVPLAYSRNELLARIWRALDPGTRVCLAVRSISLTEKLIHICACDRHHEGMVYEKGFSLDE